MDNDMIFTIINRTKNWLNITDREHKVSNDIYRRSNNTQLRSCHRRATHATDRSKWRSVISPKIAIFFKFDPIWPLKYWPKVTKIAHHKVHWRVFSPTKFGDSSSYRSWDSREGQILPPPPFPGRVILRAFPVRVLTEPDDIFGWIEDFRAK